MGRSRCFFAFFCYTSCMDEHQTRPPTRAMIGKWSVDRYVSLIRRWTIGAAGAVMLLVLARPTRWLVVGLELLIVIGIGWLVARRDGGKVESLTAGAFVGVALGLATAVGRFILTPTLTNGLAIIIETVFTMIIAALVAVSTGLIISLTRKPPA